MPRISTLLSHWQAYETIDMPGEEFGVALYEWLAGGKPRDTVSSNANNGRENSLKARKGSTSSLETETCEIKPQGPRGRTLKSRAGSL